ncbi:unnamed protein product [marine sediment metagenome]|uniref:Uncharacterized protein n=1 Tax=marine sediment metagenome TaxID=412755 RepID=X1V042_9ZZZZ
MRLDPDTVVDRLLNLMPQLVTVDPEQKSEIFVLASVVGYLTAVTDGRIGDIKDFILMNAMPGPGGEGGD